MARHFPFQLWSGRGASLLFVLAASALFTISAISPSETSIVRASAANALAPVLGMVNRPFQAAASYVETVTGLSNMQVENARLRQENLRLREWYQLAMQLQAKNQSLEKLMHVAVEPRNRFVTARVIADSGNTYVKTLLVMAGKRDGIDKGQAVISGDGLIGRTVEAGERATRVLLVNDINSRVPVIIQGQDLRAVMAGNNDGQPMLRYLPPNTTVEAGARVITSGIDGVFPFGIPVGVVESGPGGAPVVRLFADTDKLIHVRIIDQNDMPNLIQQTP